MAMVARFVVSFSRKHPISRGMVAYALLWPASNITQQFLQQRETIDYREVVRFSLFGAVYVAPSLYFWVRSMGILIPANNIKTAMLKALIDQIVYAPFAISSFYLGLGLLEGKKWEDTVKELKEKFLPTYKMGLCFWPVVQTLNFTFIRERNRVMFIGTASFFWTVYMSYMKQAQVNKTHNEPCISSIST